jgi:membrane associated rhomboid family serine protease
MSKRQAICLVLILLVGWGSAFALAYFTEHTGWAAAIFAVTVGVFAYWPIRRDDGEE